MRVHRWDKYPPLFCCSPTLYSAKINAEGFEEFQKACALVLVALSEEEWWGRYRLDEEEIEKLRDEVEEASKKKRREFADRHDGHVTLVELQDYVDDPENTSKILKHSSSLHGLLRADFLEEAYKKFDKDDSNGLDEEEWKQFVHNLARLNLQYLAVVGFQDFRAFFGRGQPWSLHPLDFSWNAIQKDLISASGRFGQDMDIAEDIDDACIDHPNYRASQQNDEEEVDDSARAKTPLLDLVDASRAKITAPNCFQVGKDPDCKKWCLIPPGWWHDLCYHSANNHPLHGVFMCDPIHPLSWMQRAAMELALIGYTAAVSVMHHRWVEGNKCPEEVHFLHDHITFILVVVTIPSVLAWKILFLLFTCKCGQVNHAQSLKQERERAWRLRTAAATLAYIMCILGILCIAKFFITIHYDTESKLFAVCGWVLIARFKSYLFEWWLILFVRFNLLIAWGTTDPSGPPARLGDCIGLGKWRIEKQRAQVKCARVADMRQAGKECGVSGLW